MLAQCPICKTKAVIVWHCPDCGDTRCTRCKGSTGKGSTAPANYQQIGCYVCKSKNVKRI